MADLDNVLIPDDIAALLAGSDSGAPAESPQEVLGQLAGGDRRWQLVAKMLEQREVAADPERESVAEDQDEQPNHRLRHARRSALRRLVAELDILRRRNDVLADALGACPDCWGADLACDTCGGAGRPGSELPDPHLFAAWVAPAVRRVRAQTAASNRQASSPPPAAQGRPASEGADT